MEIERVTSLDLAKKLIIHDPVRPHINECVRIAPGREMYHINKLAGLCFVYLDCIPTSEEELLTHNVGDIVVAYSVWSLQKGLGRKIILDGLKLIQETWRFKRFVTLSPKTDMAMKFHLSNGAKLIHTNQFSNNFEYSLK